MFSPTKKIAGIAMLIATTTLITSTVVSRQYEAKLDEAKASESAWEELGKPTHIHERMAARAGSWTQHNSYWMGPGEPQRSTGTMKLKSILGGRYLLETVRGEIETNGETTAFEGLGVHGYDRIKRKYFFAWFDNMSTSMMTGEGTADETGKVITYYSEMKDPRGETMNFKSVSTHQSDDESEFEMFYLAEDGSWVRNMRIVSTRN